MTSPPLCTACAHCSHAPSKNVNEATCDAVMDPFSGAPLLMKFARLDTWNGLSLPCGYSGRLFQAKT